VAACEVLKAYNPGVTLEEAFIRVWQASLIDGARTVRIGDESNRHNLLNRKTLSSHGRSPFPRC
jgi:hypothetical protein